MWPELPAQGVDARRGKMLSTRFGTARKRILPPSTTGVDFHSFRRSFAEGLRDAMDRGAGATVTPNIIAVLMGHMGATMALTVYAPGALEPEKRKAVNAMATLGLDPLVLTALAETMEKRPTLVRKPARKGASESNGNGAANTATALNGRPGRPRGTI